MFILALLLQAAPACPPIDRAQVVALDFAAFDQDMKGGWRILEAAECDREAANLIRDWSAAHPEVNGRDRELLSWHEGQLRAMAGDTRAAIPLLRRAYRSPADDKQFGWNHYVDGTVAFLRRDRRGFAAARARLAALPMPEGLALTGPDGIVQKPLWPMNLHVLDRMRDGWTQGYKAAYRCGAKARKSDPNQLCG